jgi:nucleoside-diphosphate-sugar epimerase
MKILFTGATGVLGSAASPASDRGRPRGGGGRPSRPRPVRPGGSGEAVAGCDAVFHFATAMPAHDQMTEREAWRPTTACGTKATANLVDAAIEQGVSTFLQESVAFAYADGGAGWLDEDAPLDPPFGAIDSALVAESHVARFTAQGGRGIVLRLGRLYGPGRVSAPYLEAVAARKLPLIGRGDNYVSHLHITTPGRRWQQPSTPRPASTTWWRTSRSPRPRRWTCW